MFRSVGVGVMLVLGGCSPSAGDSAGPVGGPLGANPGGMGGANGVPGAPTPPSGGPGEGPNFNIGGMMERPHETRCDAIVTRGEKAPLDIYVMWDKSLSMTCPTATGGTRWDAVKGAFQAFVGNPALSGIGVGIAYFGRSPNLDPDIFAPSCNPVDYEPPDVEIGLLPANAQPIINSLNGHQPETATPTLPGLGGAINHAAAWKQTHPASKVVVLLVTDGQPNLCGTVADVAGAAAGGNQRGIPTYVIGVISPNTPCAVLDPNPPNQQDLDTVAQAGGTERAFMVDASQDAAAQFASRLDEIRGNAQVPCQYQIPQPKPGTVFDSKLVNVQFTDAAGVPATIFYLDSPAQCTDTQGGWYYDNPQAPTTIHLCPSTCNVATVEIGVTLDIALGCERVTPTR